MEPCPACGAHEGHAPDCARGVVPLCATSAHPPLCFICEQAPQHRRRACRNCYRKFRAVGLPLPPPLPPGPDPRPGDAVQQVVDRMSPPARLKWLRALLPHLALHLADPRDPTK